MSRSAASPNATRRRPGRARDPPSPRSGAGRGLEGGTRLGAARAVARELRRLHVDDDVPWRDLAVVVGGAAALTSGLLRALDDAHVPRRIADAGSPATVPATRPLVLGLRWLVAGPQQRDALVEPILTSELGRLSPASVRTLLRLARAHGRPPRDALAMHELADPDDAEALTQLAGILSRAEAVAASVLDAFRVLWLELPFAADLVSKPSATVTRSSTSTPWSSSPTPSPRRAPPPTVDRSLPAVARCVGGGAEPRSRRGRPRRGLRADRARDRRSRVRHRDRPRRARGRLPEPVPARADVRSRRARRRRRPLRDQPARLADERRLFAMVRSRARRGVVLTATDPRRRVVGDAHLAVRRGARPPGATSRGPRSTSPCRRSRRRRRGDARSAITARRHPNACRASTRSWRSATTPGWWFQRDWTDLSAAAEDARALVLTPVRSRTASCSSCSRASSGWIPEGLPGVGGQAVHSIIEGCERGTIERTREAFERSSTSGGRRHGSPPRRLRGRARQREAVLIRNWFATCGAAREGDRARVRVRVRGREDPGQDRPDRTGARRRHAHHGLQDRAIGQRAEARRASSSASTTSRSTRTTTWPSTARCRRSSSLSSAARRPTPRSTRKVVGLR